jgi:cysteine desulfurase/selenocysteine lyase
LAEAVRYRFPVLNQNVNGYPLVYLDNAATTQKPDTVIAAIDDYYRKYNANIHRGAHHLAHIATLAYEQVREDLKVFLNAREKEEIIFTSGATDSINLVAQAWGRKFLMPGDEIVLTAMEHHANIVPWQMVAEERQAVIRVIPVTEEGEWELAAAERLISEKTKLVAVNHVSNALGTINPVKWISEQAKKSGALIMVDGAQAVAHMAVDVQSLDADFYAFSSHKMYGPMGVGVLYGKREWLEKMSPYRGGGEMIDRVAFSGTTYNVIPYKFEAGTPHVEGVIGLGAALKFIAETGYEQMHAHEQLLLQEAVEQLREVKGMRFIGTAREKVSVLSFLIDGVHPYDIGTLLDKQGVAVRTGHHCTQPLMDHFGIPGTVRASFAVYNTSEEVDRLVNAVNKAVGMLI